MGGGEVVGGKMGKGKGEFKPRGLGENVRREGMVGEETHRAMGT